MSRWRSAVSLSTWWRLVVWLLAACAAGGGALYFIYAERWSLSFTRQAMQRSPYLAALIVAVGMIVISRLRDRVFPGTDGTGIPQAIAALETADPAARSRLLSLRIALGKLILLTLGLFSGATLGREGPSVHLAACFLYLSSRLASFPAHIVQSGLIVAGGAAGIAAAFNAPIAGIVFAFEEIGRGFDKRNAGFVVRTVAVACLLCIFVLSNYLFYGQVDAPTLRTREWMAVAVIGPIAGFLGGCFAQAVVVTTPRVALLARRRPYFVAGAIGITLAVLGLLSGGLTYGGGDDQVRAVLMHGQQMPAHYSVTKAAASFFTLISSIPGGLFTPSLSVGAGLGDLASWLSPELNRQVVILLAMAAYFAGVVQSPVTATVIVIEMTAVRFMTLPLLATTVLAFLASRLVCPVSLYQALAQRFLPKPRREAQSFSE